MDTHGLREKQEMNIIYIIIGWEKQQLATIKMQVTVKTQASNNEDSDCRFNHTVASVADLKIQYLFNEHKKSMYKPLMPSN